MIAHVVLFKPRRDLSHADREGLLRAMRAAFTNIAQIQRVHIGRRMILGQAYEALAQIDFEYAAILEFDTEAALRAYLDHPTHVELGRRFGETAEVALVYDFAMMAPNEMKRLLE